MDATATVARPAPAAERAARMMRGFEWLMIPVVLALGFMLASFAVRNSDFWMHLATGRLIAEGKYEFGKDPFSFASGGRTWVNQSWLFDLLLYKAYGLSDDHSAIVYIKAGLVAFLALVMLLAARPRPEQSIVPGTKANPVGWVAAIAAGLALIAIAPRMLVQPALVSFVFTALTFYVLYHSARWPAAALPITIGVLFALWVNLDQWFLLGPALVALYLVGDLIQQMLPGEHRPDAARIRTLALTLVVGLAACLLNPHHFRVFTMVPQELVPSVAPSMQKDDAWQRLFISASSIIYRNKPDLGYSPPGLCYWLLMGLGVLSFALNWDRTRIAWLLIWVATATLSLSLNWRLIPFFAVVAAPIAALNFHAFFWRRPYRHGVTLAPAQQANMAASEVQAGAAAGGTQEGWWPGATEAVPAPVATTTSAPPEPAPAGGGGGMTVTPETMLDMAGVMGRLLTLVAGLALLAACYPGWLHAVSASADRRVSWNVQPEPAYVQLAQRLQQWHERGELAADARGISLSPDIVNYMAFFAPDVRTFLDYRFSLLGHLTADYMQVKYGLADLVANAEEPEDYGAVFRKYNISYVVLSTEAESVGGERLFGTLLLDENKWALRYQNGRTAVFGWLDPNAPRTPDPLRLDLVSMAFGSKVDRLPPGDQYGVTREPPPDTPPERTFFDRFLRPPPPPAPSETMTAVQYWSMRDQAYLRAAMQAQNAFASANAAAWVGMFARPTFFTAFANSFPESLPIEVARQMANIHPLPMAVSLLAVREARRGTLAHPNEGFPYLILGMAYSSLAPVSQELQALQMTTALHQAIDRLTPEQAQGPIGSIVSQAYLTLFELHINYNARDLAEEALTKALQMYDAHPPLRIREENREASRERLKQMLEKLHNDVAVASDNYQLAKEEARRRNAPVQQQVALAMQFGLIREALKVVEDTSTRQDAGTLQMAVQLYLAVGQIEQAQRVLDVVPDQAREGFTRLQVNAWIAAGEYARAGKLLEQLIATMERSDDSKRKFLAAAVIFQQLHFGCIERAAQSVLLGLAPMGLDAYGRVAFALDSVRSQRADLTAMRGMLALEEGDIPTARQYFRSALDMKVSFGNAVNAAIYLNVLDKVAAR